MQDYFVLAINPGSTSTKVTIYKNTLLIYGETIRHKAEELANFDSVISQFDFRKKLIMDALTKGGVRLEEISAVVGRGGMLRPLSGGTYKINQLMIDDLKEASRGVHASNLGAIIAHEIAKDLNVPSFVVDPVVVDELMDIARITGWPGLERKSQFHALNQKAVSRRAALELGKSIEEANFIVAHLGGGISIGAHYKGRVIDVNNALDGEGPFSPERSGSLPIGDLVRLCFSGKYSQKEIEEKLVGKGGLMAYFGTSDAKDIEQLIGVGNKNVELVYEAMAYQVAKSIGSSAVTLKGEIDAIILTGGLTYSQRLVDWIRDRVKFLAPVIVYPGEDEMLALTEGALRVLLNQEEPKEYI